MSRGPQLFTQSDVTKALKAAQKAGFKVTRFEIDRAGKIVIVASTLHSDAQVINSEANEWDSVK